MREKNLKLCEIAGWKQCELGEHHWESGNRVPNWMPPDATESCLSLHNPPDLYNSLDALFKWVVPKVLESFKGSSVMAGIASDGDPYCQITYVETSGDVRVVDTCADTPAHALAEAILKAYKVKP